MRTKLASHAALWYNKPINIVAPTVLQTPGGRTHSLEECIMDTVPPRAKDGNIPTSSGIYKITCAVTKRIYIGSAINLRVRWKDHFSALRRNKHINPHLQRAWNKYGEQTFTFEVLELVLIPELLTAREQYWFDKLKPFGRKGFNIARIAGSTQGKTHTPESIAKISVAKRGKKQSLETREKRKQTQLGKNPFLGKTHSLEAIEQNRQAHLGKTPWLGKKHTPETIEKLRQINLGRKHLPETIEKNRQASIGRRHSPEAIEKIRQAKLGKKRSPESVENMRRARWGKREGDKLL